VPIEESRGAQVSQRQRQLIVNADDFGLSDSVNDGIERAFVDGIVTSASLMVRRPAAEAAAALARRHPSLSVGLHLDLGEWVCTDGRWTRTYEIVDPEDPLAVLAEVRTQVATFRRLTGRAPTHMDSHQHVHLSGPARQIVRDEADALNVPARGLDARVNHCGNFYGQSGTGDPLADLIAVEGLLAVLDELPVGLTELGCHPASGSVPESAYDRERTIELDTLTDPRVRARLEDRGIELMSFHDVAGSRSPATAAAEVAPCVG
jgi:predicted glycoside hydrolase/deacetylase ChbG (UPF0249 family)